MQSRKISFRWLRWPRLIGLVVLVGTSAILLAYFRPYDRPESRLGGDAIPLLLPGAVTLTRGVHLLGGLQPSAAYVVETSKGLVLIDSGLESEAGPLKSQMAQLGLDWRGLCAILLTHAHGDHCGGAEHLRAATGAKVFAGSGDAGVLAAGGPREAIFSTFYQPNYTLHPTTVDVELKGGESIAFGDVRFHAMAMPGHTPGSICYFMDRSKLRVLFAGDVILMLAGDLNPDTQKRKPLGTYSAYLEPRYRGDAKSYLESLRQLRALPVPDLVLPGHPAADRTPQNPRLTPSRWHQLLDQGIRDLEVLIARYEADGPDFLDGAPKQLLPEVYYVGDRNGVAVYGFFATSGFLLVNAPGGPGLDEFVRRRVQKLVSRPVLVSAVLLTDCGPHETAGLAGLVAKNRVAVFAAPQAIQRVRELCPPGTVVLPASALAERSGCDVTALPLRGRGQAPCAYQLKRAGKTVLFSGRIPILAKAEAELELFPEISKSRERIIDYLIAVTRLGDLHPDLWLPAVPADGQNANVYDNEWHDIIAYNYRVSYRGLNPSP